MCKYNTQFIQN